MTRKELEDLIKKVYGDLLPETLEKALEPLQKQQTDWMKQIHDAAAAKDVPDSKKGIGAARFVRALAAGRGDPGRAAAWAKKVYADDLGDRVVKALQAGDFDAAGFLVPPDFVPELIELLRSRSIVRRSQPRVLPMPNGTLTLRKQTQASVATYVGESQNITTTQPVGGQIIMTAKKLAAIVPISNDLLMFSADIGADEYVRDDLVQVIATREDQAFIRDDGSQDTPKGMRYWADATNISTSTWTATTPDPDKIETDFRTLINALTTKDVQMIRPAWYMNPRSQNYLLTLRDTNGNLIYPTINPAGQGAPGSLYGWPVFTSTNIPINLGGGNESEVYLVDMFHAVIGEASTLQIAVDSSASYIDGGLQSAFARDETLMRAITRHDFAMRHDEAVAVRTGVIWGA